MKKKWTAMVLALCLAVGFFPPTATAGASDTLSAEEAIAQVNASGWMNSALKERFVQVLNTYVPNTDGYKSNTRMDGGTYNCAHLAWYTYKALFGYYYGRDGARDSYLKMQDHTSVSYSEFVSEGIYPGAHIRTGSNYSSGHSMILLDYDETYIYVYHSARHPRNGYVGIEVSRYTWDEFNAQEVQRHSKINHISVPKDYESRWKGDGAGAASPAASTLSINPTSEPGQHRTVGSPFYFRGSITSNYNVTSATIQVRGADNASIVMEKTVTPNKTKVDILDDGLDSLKFGSLGVGSYYLWLFAQDASGAEAEWIVPFSVGYPEEPAPEPEQPAPVTPAPPTPAPPTPVPVTVPPVQVETSTPTPEVIPTPTPRTRPTPTPEPTPTQKGREDAEQQIIKTFVPTRSWSALQFDDISAKAWYYENVKAAYRYTLMNGTGNGRFQPEDTLTVAQAITLAARIHAAYYRKEVPTYDSGKWYDGAVAYASRNGIPTGGSYERPATREIFAHILAAALPEEALWDNGSDVDFADADALRYPAAIELLCQAGIINGIEENSAVYFAPDGIVTRAQAAAIITRMVVPSTRLGA